MKRTICKFALHLQSMRKRLLTFFGCLGIYMTAYAGAVPDMEKTEREISVKGGVKADAVLLNFLVKAAPEAVSRFTPGASVGGFAQIDFNSTFGLRLELKLNYKQNTFSWTSNSGRFKSMGIEIPIYVTAGWNVSGTQRVFIGLGPYSEFCYYARWEIDDREVDLLKLNEADEPMIQDSQSGFGAMIGYKFGCGLSIEGSYKICYFNILQPNTSQGVALFPHSIGFGLAYEFGRKR